MALSITSATPAGVAGLPVSAKLLIAGCQSSFACLWGTGWQSCSRDGHVPGSVLMGPWHHCPELLIPIIHWMGPRASRGRLRGLAAFREHPLWVRPCARHCLCMSSHDPICHSAREATEALWREKPQISLGAQQESELEPGVLIPKPNPLLLHAPGAS